MSLGGENTGSLQNNRWQALEVSRLIRYKHYFKVVHEDASIMQAICFLSGIEIKLCLDTKKIHKIVQQTKLVLDANVVIFYISK